MVINWRWPLTKAETCRDHREHEIKAHFTDCCERGFSLVVWQHAQQDAYPYYKDYELMLLSVCVCLVASCKLLLGVASTVILGSEWGTRVSVSWLRESCSSRLCVCLLQVWNLFSSFHIEFLCRFELTSSEQLFWFQSGVALYYLQNLINFAPWVVL
jgi:hypothetical protein